MDRTRCEDNRHLRTFAPTSSEQARAGIEILTAFLLRTGEQSVANSWQSRELSALADRFVRTLFAMESRSFLRGPVLASERNDSFRRALLARRCHMSEAVLCSYGHGPAGFVFLLVFWASVVKANARVWSVPTRAMRPGGRAKTQWTELQPVLAGSVFVSVVPDVVVDLVKPTRVSSAISALSPRRLRVLKMRV